MQALIWISNDVLRGATIDALLERGHRVRVLLSEPPDRTIVWPPQVEPYLGRPGDPATLAAAVRDCDVLLVVDRDVTDRSPNGTKPTVSEAALIDVAARGGVGRLVRLSRLMPNESLPQNAPPPFPRDWISIR